MATPDRKIQAARVALGFSEQYVAECIGLGIDAYWDLEHHADEFQTVLPIAQGRRLCGLLGLDFLDMAERGGTASQPDHPSPSLSTSSPNRAAIVSQRRIQLGISEEELADQLGFEVSAIKDIERDPNYLDGWSVELVASLAEALHIPPTLLLIPNSTT